MVLTKMDVQIHHVGYEGCHFHLDRMPSKLVKTPNNRFLEGSVSFYRLCISDIREIYESVHM